jgi:ribose transport system permease protein
LLRKIQRHSRQKKDAQDVENPMIRKAGRIIFAVLADYGIVVAFVAVFCALAISTSAFFTVRNQLNILDQAAQIGIIACAATLVIIAGGFDLSAGAIFAMSGVVAALIARDVGDPYLGMVVGITCGMLIGLGNGILVTVLRINTFVATLASGIVIRGLALVLTRGLLITVPDERFNWLGRGEIFGIRVTVLIFLGFALLMAIVLAHSRFGRYVYAVGDNAEAARLSGVRVNLIRIATFGISGLAAGLAGVIAASRIRTGQANVGEGLELMAIASVVIGGTSIMGGEGAVWRTLLGVLLLRLINNGFNIMNVEPFYQNIFQGLIILFAVAFDALRHRRT